MLIQMEDIKVMNICKQNRKNNIICICNCILHHYFLFFSFYFFYLVIITSLWFLDFKLTLRKTIEKDITVLVLFWKSYYSESLL